MTMQSVSALMEIAMQTEDQTKYLSERIAFEDRVGAIARSEEARHSHAELAMHYRSELALLQAVPRTRDRYDA